MVKAKSAVKVEPPKAVQLATEIVPVAEPVKAEAVKAEAVEAVAIVKVEPSKKADAKRLIGVSHVIKQITTDVHSFEILLSPEMYDFIAEAGTGGKFYPIAGGHLFAGGSFSDEFTFKQKKFFFSSKTFRGKRVDLSKIFPTSFSQWTADDFKLLKDTLQAARVAYEKQPTPKDIFEGLETL